MSVPGEVSYLTTGQVARQCKVDPRTIARWVDAGLVPAHRTPGGRRRIARSDLDAFVRSRGLPGSPGVECDSGGGQLRIAVVDDDERIVRVVTRALERAFSGADCRVAHDGFSAGALLASFRPDLVVLDVVMPGMSGVEVCKYIRSTPELKRAAVMIVSGHLTNELRARLAVVGADRCIPKPFGPEDITSAATELLGSARIGSATT